MTEPESPRRDAWEHATSGLLVWLGIVYLAAYTWYVLRPDETPWWQWMVIVVLGVTWLAFIADVLIRIVLTPRGARTRWAFRHPIDVLSALLPVFRALRVVQLFHHVGFLERRTHAAIRTRFVLTAASYAIVFVFFIALATLEAERDAQGATIVSFGDSIWWAFVTIATVGYGDMVPITIPGRIYAVLLMIGGIAIVGTASATFVSVLNDRLGKLRGHPLATPPALTPDEEADEDSDGARRADGPGPVDRTGRADDARPVTPATDTEERT